MHTGRMAGNGQFPERLRKVARAFFTPRLNRWFAVRIGVAAAMTLLVCTLWLRPAMLNGESMQPAYSGHGFTFCNRLAYRHRLPHRGEVVILRWGGERWMLIKRAVAFAGETVEFRDGRCLVNGTALDEPYVRFPCDWNAPAKLVPPGHLYVVGDNRSMPQETHVSGIIAARRLYGKPLW